MNRSEVLADMQSRLLLQMLGLSPPMRDAVTRELQSMLGRSIAVSSGVSLDLTRSP
jgi:hypothetical protein